MWSNSKFEMQLRDRTNRELSPNPGKNERVEGRRFIKAVRKFNSLDSPYSIDDEESDDFNRSVLNWMNPPETILTQSEISFPSYNSIPPQPDFTLLVDFASLHDREDFAIPVRQGCVVTREIVETEHGNMETFLNRMLLQILKRRWFTALTEFNTTHLFGMESPPSRFLQFLDIVHSALEEHICADANLGSLYRSGRIRLVLKGGNCVALLKLQVGYLSDFVSYSNYDL